MNPTSRKRLPFAGSAALAAAMLLTACSIGARPAPTLYDFGPPAARLTTAPATTPLAVEVRAPHWLDSPGIDYRLAYADAQRVQEYAGSRWLAPPAQLLAQRLRQQLGATAAASNVAAACILRVDLHEFSQVFEKEEQSAGVIQAQAVLLDARRRLIAGRSFAIERPAGSADARGAAAALLAASDALGGELAGWLNSSAPTARACAGSLGANAGDSAARLPPAAEVPPAATPVLR
ncbi:ABC-type transport auxiliary lipoprotein family protein [Rhodocyclus tenuis]|uniref:ABC-type uncharacterized transport system auxiliary subunit n=1 Tax=Rhodocyclus tenuis TaxID=1066 RepID=A0A840GEF4_RHOTE|nr:ABC-type transport auxiliary lipoprotein family protein [Rhodocyclus tenuis]MBB4249018.1 ABC-type uncharacterized transport system auxiliary subunit [Rhodocyclus tenuis]